MQKKEKIYLIDGYNFIYRLFYAIPPFTTKDGTPINTVFGLAKMILGWHTEDKPDYLIFILDYKGKNFREAIFPNYKGTRDKMPSELKAQEVLIFDLLKTFKIPEISLEGYEADDIIGTFATKYKGDPEKDIFILSGDKDLFQFIGDNVKVYDTMKRKIYSREDSFEKFGVYPEHVVDYLSICGDTSDNIPGIPGFGPKKAQELIGKYGNLENIYENIENISGKSKDTLVENKEVAFLSKKLASIVIDLELKDFALENHIFRSRDILDENVVDFFKRFEFKSLIPDKHKDEIKNFPTLGVKIEKITDNESLHKLEEKISKLDKISISTNSNIPFNLDTITIYTGEKIAFSLSTQNLDIKPFLKKILDSKLELISFDLKEDYKRIYSYINNSQVAGNTDTLQASLF